MAVLGAAATLSLLAVTGAAAAAPMPAPGQGQAAAAPPPAAAAPAPLSAAAAQAKTADTIIKAADKEIGTKETGENCQKYSDQCVSWCALFAMSTWQAAGVDVDNEKYAFTGNVYEDGKAKGTAYDSGQLSQAKRGDVLLFGTGPSTAKTSKHIGVVEKVDGDKVTTIEGNAGDNTDQVVRKEHKLSADTFYGGVHPW